MYNKHYHFTSDPFCETPNTSFYFASQNHIYTMQELATHLDQGHGFILVTGEVGTGKTMLARYLIKMCEEEIDTAYLYWPTLGGDELIKTIAREFGVLEGDQNFAGLEKFLLKNAELKRRSILFIDEAQSLPLESLEMIRLLSNLESETKKLIQIVMIGQPELNKILAKPEARQISQRISLRLNLQPLPLAEVELYIKHRIEQAKGTNSVRFELSAIKTIFNYSNGIPRLINLICRISLEQGAKEKVRIVDTKLVIKALEQNLLIPQSTIGLFRPKKLNNIVGV